MRQNSHRPHRFGAHPIEAVGWALGIIGPEPPARDIVTLTPVISFRVNADSPRGNAADFREVLPKSLFPNFFVRFSARAGTSA